MDNLGKKMKAKNLLLLLPLLVNSAIAEENIETEEIIVRNYQYDSKESTSPYSIEIHTAKDIKASGSTSVQSYLNQNSSLNMTPNFGGRAKSNIDMRGYGNEAGYQNLVISLDGQRINNIDNSPQFIGQIDINSIDRIEIVKGTGSVRYGDGAMSGVINIYTKSYSGFSLESSIGSAGLKKNTLNAGFSHENFQLSLSATDDKSEGVAARDTNGNKDKFRNKTHTAKLNIDASDDTKLYFGVSNSRVGEFAKGYLLHNKFHEDPKQNSTVAYNTVYNNFDYDNDRYSAGIDHKYNKNLDLNANVYYEDKLYNAFNGGGDKYTKGYFGSNFTGDYKGEGYNLTGGLQYFDGERKSVDKYPGKTSKQNISVFIESNFQPKGLSDKFLFTAGTRREQVNYRNVDTLGKDKTRESLTAFDLGVNYAVSEKLSIFSNINHGFQAPDIDRFFKSAFGTSDPYPYLGREFKGFMKSAKVKTLNIGLNNITNRNKLKVVAFYSDLNNEIVFNPSTFGNENLDNSKKYGLEVQNEFKFNEKTSAKVLYNFIKAKVGKDGNFLSNYKGNDMPGVSQHAIVLNLNHKFSEQGAINITHSWKDESYAINDWANVGILKTPFYNSTDLNVNYDIKNQDYFNNVSVFGGIQNIFEHKNAQTVKGSSTTAYYAYNYKRTWVTGVKIDF